MKPMLPSLTFDLPVRPDWQYEVKYDGFRAMLVWNSTKIELISRNGRDLLKQFPEIKEFLLRYEVQFKPYLPLHLDGELVYLENTHKANFSAIQVRGRLKSEKKISEQATRSPCRLMVFDLLLVKGKGIYTEPFYKRKEALAELFQAAGFKLKADPYND